MIGEVSWEKKKTSVGLLVYNSFMHRPSYIQISCAARLYGSPGERQNPADGSILANHPLHPLHHPVRAVYVKQLCALAFQLSVTRFVSI
jgi:hypothetical protein